MEPCERCYGLLARWDGDGASCNDDGLRLFKIGDYLYSGMSKMSG